MKGEGWMTYYLHIDGQEKPRRVYWRNHNNSYIKYNGAWVRVYFNHWILEGGSYDMIRMALVDGEWEMRHEYTQLSGPGAKYAIIG